MQKKLLLLYFLLLTLWLQAQQTPTPEIQQNHPQWVQLLYAQNPDAALIQQAFDSYYKINPFVKNEHTQYYKRWLRDLARAPWAGMSEAEKRHYDQQQERYTQQSLALQQERSPNSIWQGIGPFDFDKTAASTSYACGAAHIYTVEKSVSNPNLLYAGTATAGVWKSINNGKNWSLATANLSMTSVRALEIDHSNSKIVYAASDLDGKLYKTTNGAATWQSIGDTAFSNLQHGITDIVMHPIFNNILLVASNQGLYRTNDGGATWTQISTGIFQEIEFHPHLPNIVYVIKQIGNKTEFYKSIDNGVTFVLKTNGWPVPLIGLSEQKRTEIAVSPADSNKIYALLTGAIGFASGLYGIWISNDAGESWSSSCCGAHLPNYLTASNPNLMHWSDDGSSSGGQYYYDLALAVSPNNSDSVLVAGVNLWFSTDGANSFSCPAQWDHSYKNNYVHADIHDIRYYDNEIWIACDGGIFYSDNNGASFEIRMNGIQGTDFWGFGAGFQDGEVMLGGTFHNGTLLKDNQVYTKDWISTDGGDNYRGYVHPIHQRIAFGDYGKKQLSGNRSIPNINTTFAHLPHAGTTVGFAGNIAFHPQVYNTLYSTDFYYLWKSQDNGLTWELVYNFGSGLITSLEISWSNPKVLYLNYHPTSPTAERKIYRSNNGGLTWNDITPNNSIIPNDRWVTYDLTISGTDENTLWAARVSKYEGSPILDGNLVYQTTDGGQTWTNITTPDLDGVYITNIEHQKGSANGLYLGARKAVYYKSANLPSWVLFNNGLPLRTHSVQLVPYYKAGKLRNGTNHSVYEVDFYENSPPVAQISVHHNNSDCPRDTFYFASHSAARDNAIYSWQFTGGTPSSSTLENPKVVFASAGTYSVTLTVSDSLGTSTQVLNNFISVKNSCIKDTLAGYALQLSTNNDYILTPKINQTFDKITLSAWVKPNGIQNQFTGIITHQNDSFPAGLLLNSNNELMFQWAGAQWSWKSGLFVPVDTWSHVAVVIYPDSARVYLNGISSTYQANLLSFNWKDGLVIGRYANWFARTFKGNIDEVCVWDTCLTQTQIRATMHLTKYETQEPHLLHYYQFNHNTTLAQDSEGIAHGAYVGGANKVLSTAPIGGGTSQKIIVNTAGPFLATSAFTSLFFNNSGTYPNGELIINRLNVSPDQTVANLATKGYWIINNYGLNTTFTSLDSIIFTSPNNLNSNPNNYQLYQRGDRAEGQTWSAIDTADAVYNNNKLLFFANLNLSSFGQFMVGTDSAVLVYNNPITAIFPNEISVYPNPISTHETLSIQTNSSEQQQVELYDITGKKILEKEGKGPTLKITLPELASGVYNYVVREKGRAWKGLLIII